MFAVIHHAMTSMRASLMQGFMKSLPVLMAGLLAGCTQQVNVKPYEEYLRQAPAGTFNDVAASPRLQPFTAMFATLAAEDIQRWIDQVYADELYFNDTFHTFTRREQIQRYFLSLAGKAETRVTPLDYAEFGEHVWLRWKMQTRFSVFWRELDITTVGMTHLRYNDQGLIVMHQDYWDGVEGFHAHLPFIGSVLRSIRANLGETE